MLIRLALFLSILLIGVSTVMYLVTRDARYYRFATQVLRFMVYALMIFGVLYLFERWGVVAWGVLA
jgi:hypothetical protein